MATAGQVSSDAVRSPEVGTKTGTKFDAWAKRRSRAATLIGMNVKASMRFTKERVHLGVLVGREQRQALAELARREGNRSVSSVTREAIDAYLREREQQPRPPRAPAAKEASS
jgi:hypothetical protein